MQLSQPKVLVTGAGGFIGSHLCQLLLSLGHEVHALSRRDVPDGQGVRWWRGNLAEEDVAREILEVVKPDLIFHLAGEVTGSRDAEAVIPTFQSNLTATVNLLLAAREAGCERILIAGSLEEPDPKGVDFIPCSPYAAAKFAGTSYARMFHALYGVPVVLVRLFMVYGPGQRDGRKLIPYVITSLLRGEAPKISSGTRKVDWIYVGDVVQALLAAAQKPNIEGKVIDVGSGELTPVKTVVERLVQLIGPGVKPLFGALPDRAMERVCAADIETSFALAGWKPATSLIDGLRLTVEWYERQLRENAG